MFLPEKYPGRMRRIAIDSSRIEKEEEKQLIISENKNLCANHEFRTLSPIISSQIICVFLVRISV